MAKAKKKAGDRSARKRRGTGEDFTEKQAGAVEVRAAFNQGDLKLPDPQDYQHHRKTILGYFDQMKSAQGRYRKALKAAQAVGIDTDAMLEAKRIKDANDPKSTAHRLNQLAFALEQEGVPIHITIQDTMQEEHLDSVYRRFYQDGRAGKTLDNPYPDGSDLALQASRAWRHGTASNLKPPVSPEKVDEQLDDDERERISKLPPPPDMSQIALH